VIFVSAKDRFDYFFYCQNMYPIIHFNFVIGILKRKIRLYSWQVI